LTNRNSNHAHHCQKQFWEQAAYSDAQGPLESWHEEALKTDWKSPRAVKAQYRSTSICDNNRVVFNIGGNKYRLVVEMQYQMDIACVKFIGTHAQYDKINLMIPYESLLADR